MQMTSAQGVNRFVLKGKENASVRIQIRLGYFANAGSPDQSAVRMVGVRGIKVSKFYRSILDLEIPDDIKGRVVDDEDYRDRLKRLSPGPIPLFALAVGRDYTSGQESVQLHCINRTSPEVALKSLQDGLREAIAQQS